MQTLFNWLDQRLDYRRWMQLARQRVLPQGPSWWSTSASCLFWLLIIECVTGLMLMASYSPSMASAWASVHFIDQTTAGRFLRGIHHFSSHALIILFTLHVLRVLLAGAFRAPRELVWITGLLLFPLIIIWTVTGNPLSASQKAIAQIQVEGNILGATPVVGPTLQRLLFGGEDIGNLTLTRLYFLHVGLLPLLVGSLCFLHLHQVLKHSSYRAEGGCAENASAEAVPYWPYQSVRNIVALSLIVGAISWISWQSGAPLYAPADPDLLHSPRPEWYFRWLFELRRHFSGDIEFIATQLIPGLFLLAFLTVPFLDQLVSRRFSLQCRMFIVFACCFGWGWLTYMSYARDWNDLAYMTSVTEFEALSDRALELAQTHPITNQGAAELLRNDPFTQGPLLFARHCASCHSLTDAAGQGITAEVSSAPNLSGIGRRDWIGGFFSAETVSDEAHFGKTKFRDGDMARFIQKLVSDAGEDGAAALSQKLMAVAAALAAEAGQEAADSTEAIWGRELLVGELGCVDCHKFQEQGELGTAPDLTGYMSADWLAAMIARPNAERFYGDRNDRMPSFAADATHPELNLLSAAELGFLVTWMTQPGDRAQGVGKNPPAQRVEGISVPRSARRVRAAELKVRSE